MMLFNRKRTQMIFAIALWAAFISPGVNASAQQDASANVYEHANTYLKRMVPFGFNGALLIAHGHDIMLNQGYGMADPAHHRLNTSNTIFALGSIVKPFTATLIMKLVEDGKIGLHDELSDYFPNTSMDKKHIQIGQLLAHSSGLPEALGSDVEQISKKEFLNRVWATGLKFEPGTEYGYSNVGYSLLAMIIENVTGMDYEAFLRKTILDPAGMFHTGYAMAKWNRNDIAHNINEGHDNGIFPDRKYYPTWHLIGNGGMLSTTEDMYKFYLLISGDRLLSDETKKIMWKPVFMEDALGWVNSDDGDVLQHNGGSTDGNGAVMKWYVKEDLFVMLFTNTTIDGKLGFEVVEEPIENILFGDSVALPPEVTPIPLSEQDKHLSGNYETPSGATFLVQIASDKIKFNLQNQEAVNLFLNDGGGGSRMTQNWNDKIENAMSKAIEKQDAGLLLSICDHPASLAKEIANELSMAAYQAPKVRVLYSTFINKETYQTLVAVSDDLQHDECLVFHLLYKEGKFVGMGVNYEPAVMPQISFVLSENHTLVGYDFNSHATVEVAFTADNQGRLKQVSNHGLTTDISSKK